MRGGLGEVVLGAAVVLDAPVAVDEPEAEDEAEHGHLRPVLQHRSSRHPQSARLQERAPGRTWVKTATKKETKKSTEQVITITSSSLSVSRDLDEGEWSRGMGEG